VFYLTLFLIINFGDNPHDSEAQHFNFCDRAMFIGVYAVVSFASESNKDYGHEYFSRRI
jgi:hypothetical protein